MTNEEFRQLKVGTTVKYREQWCVVLRVEHIGNLFFAQVSNDAGTWVSNPKVLEKA